MYYDNNFEKLFDEAVEEMERKTIGELKEMPCDDGWGHIPTIGENENWPGRV